MANSFLLSWCYLMALSVEFNVFYGPFHLIQSFLSMISLSECPRIFADQVSHTGMTSEANSGDTSEGGTEMVPP